MADATLSTGISKLSMLPRAVPPPSAFARLDRDGELLRWVAAAQRCWDAFARQDDLRDWLYDAVGRHPDVPWPMLDCDAARSRWDAVAADLGLPGVDARADRLHARYRRAARTAFAIPAHGLPGLRAKLRLGLAVVKTHRIRTDALADFGCLDMVLADLERMAG